MKTQLLLPVLFAAALTTSACKRETPATTTSPSTPSAMDQAEQHLKAAGAEIKQAATQAAADAKPALHEAKEEARDLTHRAAEKVSEMTAPTQPATATQP